MKKLAAVFSLIRPLNFVITFCVIAVGYLISAEENLSYFILICAALSGALTLASGNIVNDIFDIQTDKINHPFRPLASGIISYNTARLIWFIVTLFSFIVSSLISVYSFLIVFGVHLLLIFYSYKLKSAVLSGNIVVALLTSLAFVFGAYAAGNFSRIIYPAAFAFVINFIREIVKDLQDVKGDRMNGIITYPVRYGFENTKKIIIAFIIILLILTLYSFFSHYYNIEFFILMMVVVNPLMFYVIKMFVSYETPVNLKSVSGILKLNMIVGLLAIYIGQ